ncbi:MAG: flagellar biosynthetic protein FliO [Treponema sp.]|nr:flagellar biosynthetic protein FliO [Treponema sp.]
MVKNIKSLFCISLLFALTFNFVFAQSTSSSTASTDTVVSGYQPSAFETNTDYFAEPSGEANTTAITTKTGTAKMIIKMIVALVLVVAALYGIMLFFKKKNNPTQSDDDFMRRVSSLNFAPGKSIEVVTLVDRCFMLGVTDSNINLIAEITDKEMISALNLNFDKKQNTKKPMNFSDVLEIFMPNGPRNRTNVYQNTEQAVENLSTAGNEEDENK